MSTDLTREQACDKFIAQKMRDGAGGLNRIISRAAFEAGWSARDAEVERLRAACKEVHQHLDNIVLKTPTGVLRDYLCEQSITLQLALVEDEQ